MTMLHFNLAINTNHSKLASDLIYFKTFPFCHLSKKRSHFGDPGLSSSTHFQLSLQRCYKDFLLLDFFLKIRKDISLLNTFMIFQNISLNFEIHKCNIFTGKYSVLLGYRVCPEPNTRA